MAPVFAVDVHRVVAGHDAQLPLALARRRLLCPRSAQRQVDELEGASRDFKAVTRRDRVGFVFQAYNLIPVLSAYENAEFVLMMRGVGEAERRDKVMATLAAVGLAGMEHRLPGELSGGQQQRVAVARAIVGEPALVLADEPTANLDSKTGYELLDLMRTLNEERGVTFVFATHDPKVMEAARRVVTLVDGRIAEDLVK